MQGTWKQATIFIVALTKKLSLRVSKAYEQALLSNSKELFFFFLSESAGIFIANTQV